MAATTEIKNIPENAFQECFESWKKRMHKCFQVEGDYFKGIRLWYILIFFNKIFITPVSLLLEHTSYVSFWLAFLQKSKRQFLVLDRNADLVLRLRLVILAGNRTRDSDSLQNFDEPRLWRRPFF